MQKWKAILIHGIPVAVLAIAAGFGLSADETNSLTQVGTDIVTGIFAIIAIYMHHKAVKGSK